MASICMQKGDVFIDVYVPGVIIGILEIEN